LPPSTRNVGSMIVRATDARRAPWRTRAETGWAAKPFLGKDPTKCLQNAANGQFSKASLFATRIWGNAPPTGHARLGSRALHRHPRGTKAEGQICARTREASLASVLLNLQRQRAFGRWSAIDAIKRGGRRLSTVANQPRLDKTAHFRGPDPKPHGAHELHGR